MSLLLDALRKTDDNRRPADPTPAQPVALSFELEPLAPRAVSAESPVPVAAQPLTPAPIPAGRQALPDWRLTTLCAAIGALLAGIWLALTPAALPISPAHAAPAPQIAIDTPELEEAPAPDTSPDTSPATAPPRPSVSPAPPLPRPPHRAAQTASPTEAPRFRPSPTPPSAGPSAITLAHDAYTRGDLPRAANLYQQALAADPNSVDALNGLGAIALVQHRPAEADALFRRALQARPLDPTALAGLARLPSANQPPAESQLKDAIAALGDAPESLAPRLALADLLARQQRWAEAQQQYFDAHRLAPQDADIVYNLAVSLDHLGQQRLAARHYRQALTLAAGQSEAATRFSRARCAERLATLPPLKPAP